MCRDTSFRVVGKTSINLSFFLLEWFTKERNMYAPIIYKSMVFILIECYSNVEIRGEILRNFITLFKQNKNVPI